MLFAQSLSGQTLFKLLPFYSQLILLMQKPKAKFYQLSPQETQAEQIDTIYKMISNQERTMEQILTKYNGEKMEDSRWQTYNRESKTLDYKPEKSRSNTRKYKKSRTKIHSSGFDLPVITSNPSALQMKRKKHRLPDFKPTPYFSQLKNTKDMQKMRQILEKAYLTQKVQKIQRTKSILSIQKSTKKAQSRVTASNMSVIPKNEENKNDFEPFESRRLQKEIPEPLGYIKAVEGEDDEVSSNEGDVPLSFYERQFKGAIRAQCLEQTNFLYFSKNQSMKDWTQNLLLMLQKHDKQLAVLKKRCKYLQTFDNNFFSIDIFRND